ncbi:glycosyltransferase [Sulfuracidifex tepidarius]|uniref:glycosyltransferase n=1 Tax=Sulfuracidifex tepidarius TaxID=1294262 RepID=UPI0006D27666|nr:glycosyltransferase [Sulfuracidifex tepidarius]
MINKIVFALTFLGAGILTILTLGIPWLAWLNYLIWLSSAVGTVIFINFIILSFSNKREEVTLTSESTRLRVASFVTSFNEDPEIVKGTLDSVVKATKGYGDVFLLDDSTNERVSNELKKYCESVGITYIHRTDRKGFKAGAINNALRMIHGYDLVSIFDADQRPVKSYFHDILQYFQDPNVAMVQVPQNYTELGSPVALVLLPASPLSQRHHEREEQEISVLLRLWVDVQDISTEGCRIDG